MFECKFVLFERNGNRLFVCENIKRSVKVLCRPEAGSQKGKKTPSSVAFGGSFPFQNGISGKYISDVQEMGWFGKKRYIAFLVIHCRNICEWWFQFFNSHSLFCSRELYAVTMNVFVNRALITWRRE